MHFSFDLSELHPKENLREFLIHVEVVCLFWCAEWEEILRMIAGHVTYFVLHPRQMYTELTWNRFSALLPILSTLFML